MAKKETTKKKGNQKKNKKTENPVAVENNATQQVDLVEEVKEEEPVTEEAVDEIAEVIDLDTPTETTKEEIKEEPAPEETLLYNDALVSEVFTEDIVAETIEEISAQDAETVRGRKIINAYMSEQTNQYEEIPLVPMKRNPKNIFFRLKETIKRKLNFEN